MKIKFNLKSIGSKYEAINKPIYIMGNLEELGSWDVSNC